MTSRRHGPGPHDLAVAAQAAGVRDERVLQAIRLTPRDAFVPARYAEMAYADEPVPISYGQTTSQPSLIAAMVAALYLTGAEKVLEVGTGYGYQTALLAHLAAQVISIDMWPDMVVRARENLAGQGISNAVVITGDGSQGGTGTGAVRRDHRLRRLPRGAAAPGRPARRRRAAGPARRPRGRRRRHCLPEDRSWPQPRPGTYHREFRPAARPVRLPSTPAVTVMPCRPGRNGSSPSPPERFSSPGWIFERKRLEVTKAQLTGCGILRATCTFVSRHRSCKLPGSHPLRLHGRIRRHLVTGRAPHARQLGGASARDSEP